MSTFYLFCAIIGGTWMLCQLAMTLCGLGGSESGDAVFDSGAGHSGADASGEASPDADGNGEHGSALWFFKIVTVRTMTAAVAFFGLAGLAVQSSGGSPGQSLLGAGIAGFAAMYVVHWLLAQMFRFDADGTVNFVGLIGMTGNVYLRIPAERSAAGKIHVTTAQGTLELLAWSSGPAIATGTRVRITALTGDEAVDVIPLSIAEEPQHA